ncbi:MAG: LTA synthase family protein, partial [Proteobacteria bacterium]
MTLSTYIRKPIKITLISLAIVLYCFLMFLITGLIFEATTDLVPISRAKTSFYFEPISLFITFVILAIVTRRILLSLILITGIYIVLMLINTEMMKIFGLTFSPGDIKHSMQVFLAPEIWLSYWKELLLVLILILFFLIYYVKTTPNRFLNQYRYMLFSFLTIFGLLVFFYRFSIAEKIRTGFDSSVKVVPIELPQQNGFLFAFYYQLLQQRKIKPPINYSPKILDKIIDKHNIYNNIDIQIKPHVIIFFIEAFADPKQVDIKTSFDPIPNFRKYAQKSLSGFVISPEIGGRSANPEFELLTGLSMRFMPEKSIPYIDYLTRPLPSLAREFKNNGYSTHAIHVATMKFFNYEKAYHYLGFDYYYTLYNRENIERDIRGRYPSEKALVNEIINITESNDKPQFIFSFPNSTHGFWDYDAYLNSDLDVYGDFIGDGKSYLKTYINSIHTADKAIGKLINHFEKSTKPAIILVLGDHQPSLPEFRQNLYDLYFDENMLEKKNMTRQRLKRKLRNNLNFHYDYEDRRINAAYRTSNQV